MLEKLGFALSHYLALTLFVVSCWGWGQAATRSLRRADHGDRLLSHAISTALGIGVAITALQFLAIGGWLRPLPIAALVSIGGALALVSWLREPRPAGNAQRNSRAERFVQAILPLLVTVAAVSTGLAPLGPTGSGDDAMYHLPHARQWAQTGSLQVNDWLRYPWFPYNFNLLYAAALVLQDDILAHLLHALAGWLTTLIIYRLGVRHVGTLTAALAALFWLVLTKGEYRTAYIDMGVTLFVLAGCVCLQHWRERPTERGWLAVAAFLIGVAAGSKYQVLGILPIFAVTVLWNDRRLSTMLLSVVALLLPCVYWYIRNFVLTGDPFNPVGGVIFGFSDWDAGDLAYQFDDIKRHADWPSPMLWAAVLAPLVPALRRIPAARAAMAFAAFAVAGWIVSSRYPRYLMLAYPTLALLSAAVWSQPAIALSDHWQRKKSGVGQWAWIVRGVGAGVTLMVIVMVGAWSIRKLTTDWHQFAGNLIERQAIMRSRVDGYEAFEYLKRHPVQKIYQFGLEASLYYAPQPLFGDHFGRWRYRDFYPLPPRELAAKLRTFGFDTVIVHTENVAPFNRQHDFKLYFQEVFVDRNVSIYHITDPN